jgi:hypothetical protein
MQVAGTTSGSDHPVATTSHLKATERYVFAAVTVLFVASVALNVVLARKVRSLVRMQPVQVSPLEIGASVPPITAKRVNGAIETIAYSKSDGCTVLYVFTPTCIWCERNLDNIKKLAQSKDAEYRFIGLSLSDRGLSSYLASNGLALPTYTNLTPDALEAYKLHGTPQTIVVSPEGRVIQNWMGAYVGKQKSEVEAFFHVSLPGIPPPQSAH